MHLKEYNFVERIGSGTYGEVFKAYKKTGSRDVVAVKCVLKSKLSKREVDNLISEISLLKHLKHEHIVEMIDFTWDSSYIYIIMEYCGRGDLSKFIKTRKLLSESSVRGFLQQLALALRFLRSKNIAHMDLKPQNILIAHNRTLKLGDFGFAKKIEKPESAVIGSPLYMAPEIILDRRYDAKVDLWSVGVILFECLFGRAPYKSSSVDELLRKIKEEKPIVIPSSPKISSECRDLLTRLLDRDPVSRIDFEEFFDHPFLDLEHAPCPENIPKATDLVTAAIRADQNSEYEEALRCYREALEYFVPLVQREQNPSKKLALRKRVDEYIGRAEEIKRKLSPSSSYDDEECKSLGKPSFKINEDFEELFKLSNVTPQLKTGLEIADSAEMYEYEGRYQLALERYEVALGILIPLLSSEPKGTRRKILLRDEISRWMKRAETVKELLEAQKTVGEETLQASSSSDKNCLIQ